MIRLIPLSAGELRCKHQETVITTHENNKPSCNEPIELYYYM